ncbi:MAG: HIT domain-containing protein [Actinomycetota bacterium]|nr:HIT domain-containing protein [Actinomycetota bacterium]
MSLDQMWAGWRSEFVESIPSPKEDCILCALGRLSVGVDTHVLLKGDLNFVVMNAFPYAPGHVMVVPYAHEGEYLSLGEDVVEENLHLTRRVVAAIKKVYGPDGFNLGANIGKAGGAAIAAHIHFHIVPRWIGDTNFMTSVANTRVLPESLAASYERISSALD